MQPNAERAHFNMIEQQIRPWDVLDERVLKVMLDLPREPFVPEGYQGLAYADIEVPLGEGAVMLQPRVVGRMLQALAVRPGDRVLEIGTGSGYVTALLARLGAQVRSIEIDPDLAEAAAIRLAALGLSGIEILTGDGLAGAPDGGPFNAIALTGSLPTEEPLALLREQLRDGGRLFAVVGEGALMRALLLTRCGADWRLEVLFETAIPPLQNAPQRDHFQF